MKVLHLISGGDTGGAKTHVHTLLSGLTGKVDVKMVCFTEGPFAQEARSLGIDTLVLPSRNFFKNLKILTELVKKEGFDILHSHGSRGNMMSAILGRRTGLPTVSTVHSDYRLDYLGRPLSRLTYGTINSIALRRIKYRIGVSDAMVDLLIHFLHLYAIIGLPVLSSVPVVTILVGIFLLAVEFLSVREKADEKTKKNQAEALRLLSSLLTKEDLKELAMKIAERHNNLPYESES